MLHNAKTSAFIHFLSAGTLCSWLLAPSAGFADAVSLIPLPHAESITRVKTMVDAAGSLRVETRDKKPVEIPLEVKAEIFFDERGLSGNHAPSVRHYWQAQADFDVNGESETRQLREDRQLIVIRDDQDLTNRFWSPHGMMYRQELDLLDVAGGAFPPERLLSQQKVDVDDSWAAEDATTAELLRLEEVNSGELTSTVQEITESTVKIELVGTIKGIADGAKTRMEVRGNYHFDRTTRVVSWLALAIREKREIGFATPGFEVTARIRTARQAIDKSSALSNMLVTQARREPTPGDLLLDFESDSTMYRAAIDRRWYLIQSKDSEAVMRLIEDGDLLTTCKINRLNRMPEGKQITLSGFQGDVQAALANNCKEIAMASESLNPQGIRVLRVVARGDVGETPIQWVYYHLSDDLGQRLSLVFTHESAMESRLAGLDESLTSSITILPRKSKEDQPDRQARLDAAEER